MREFAVAFTLLCFTSACVTNPARRISVTDQEVFVHDENGEPAKSALISEAAPFARGDETLDEQEFYEAIGDTESFTKVRGSRTAGEVLQGIGFSLALIGLAALATFGATYLLSAQPDDEMMKPTLAIPDETRGALIYGVYGGIGALVGGSALWFGMHGKSRGSKLVFPLSHARKQMEVARYGADGATPDDVKSLSFADGNVDDLLCAHGQLPLTGLVARDALGRQMKVSDRSEWFEWMTTPVPGLVNRSPDAPVLTSALDGSLEHVDSPVGLTIRIPQTGVGHSRTFDLTFACGAAMGRGGSAGRSGGRGQSGRDGSSGTRSHAPGVGASGGDGGDGGDGAAGPSLRAEVTWVTTPKRGRLALLVVGNQAQLFDPTKNSAVVSANGGSGGDGGAGGHGGKGGGTGFTCLDGAPGASGGRGGRGGRGGSGGSVSLFASDAALLEAVTTEAPGGRGGGAGPGGVRGDGGSSSSCTHGKGFTRSGPAGANGPGGSNGSSGSPGSTQERVVSTDELTGIAEVLAKYPQLTLDGAAPMPAKKKRR